MDRCKILIADDERLAREAIKLQLQNCSAIDIVAECANGSETLHAIRKFMPDIVFLDIQMPLLSGMEVVESLGEENIPFIIFVTAHDQYALKAFEANAVDYLVKPFTDDRFQKAFRKAYCYWNISRQDQSLRDAAIEEVKKIYEGLKQNELRQTISVRDGSRTFVLPLDEIIYIEAAGNYAAFYHVERKHLHRETLQTLEETLPSSFIRIHKSIIVNAAFIKEFHSLLNGDYIVKLKTGQELKLSRNYRSRVSHLL